MKPYVSLGMGAGLLLAVLAGGSPGASAAGLGPAGQRIAAPPVALPAQVEVYVGRPYRPYYAPRYGYRYYEPRPYYRPYYAPPPPPPVTYYETRPYVAQPTAPYGYGDPDALARCASKFKSFNAHTGTYVTYSGEVRRCPYLP